MDYVGFVDKQVCTRKDPSCDWCPEPIPSGSDAQHREYIFAGIWQRGWMHAECDDAMNASHLDDNGFMPQDQKRGVAVG